MQCDSLDWVPEQQKDINAEAVKSESSIEFNNSIVLLLTS